MGQFLRLTPEQLELAEGRPVIWAPSEKQIEFLSAGEDEVLYGGAAGGGKSDSALIDALGLNYDHGPAIDNPNHRAIIFRRTYPELVDLISRAKELYPEIRTGTKYNSVEHCFTFPSGATVEFAHLQHDHTALKYRGRAFNYILFEELTLWASPFCWNYLRSRNRTVDPRLPCYMRATTNPDGPGMKWVMDYWGIGKLGNATMFYRDIEDEREVAPNQFELYQRRIWRRFIPARLTDNLYLRGTGYRAKLNDMEPHVRDALLYGLWTEGEVKGAYYAKQMQAAMAAGRIRPNLPLTADPINTFWDLGWNDNTSIIFHQAAVGEHRFPLAYQNSGEELAHYVQFLADASKERKWRYGTHYLPHDADTKTLASGKNTVLKQLQQLMPGSRFVVVPRIPNLMAGIQVTRARFPVCYFDEEGCSDLISALRRYRKKWDAKRGVYLDEPEHDGNSHYADAFRQFGQGWEPSGGMTTRAKPVVQVRRVQ